METNNLLYKTKEYFKELISKYAKIPADAIDSEEELETYGIDSLMIINLNKEMESVFGNVSRTLFFEYKNIDELANYFVHNYTEKLEVFLGGQQGVVGENANIEKKSYRQMHNFKVRNMIPLLNQESKSSHKEEIAIIGISGKYPMAGDLSTFWNNLKDGRDCITEVPKDRWDVEEMYDPDKTKRDKIYTKWGGFLDDVDKFDASFFNLTPREANTIDPQERLFLENAWKVFEDAGYPKSKLNNRKIGVFAGVMFGQYQIFGKEIGEKDLVPTSSYASVANRVSYYFNLTGPSLAVDTMCSSSLSSIHLACESILNGESEMALAGGVSVSIHPLKYRILSQQRFASSEGKCRAFGEGGDGYVSGEGVGAVLLKPLSKAKEDGDYIYAVIKGSAMNHGGKTNGYSVPNPNAQENLIKEVLKKTEINPETISYLEAHGTGTSLGDPIEITGLTKAYGSFMDKKSYCPIGSVKSNIGHTEGAAGIAAVTKVVLMMQHKKLVPSLNSDVLNSNIQFKDTPFYVQHDYEDWNCPKVAENGRMKEYPRRAGVSAFGAGGTNVHIILEEYKNKQHVSDMGFEENIFMLSAKNEERLQAYAKKVLQFIKTEGETKSIADILFSFQNCKEPLEERLAFTAKNISEIEAGLQSFLNGDSSEKIIHKNVLDFKKKVMEYSSDMIDGLLKERRLQEIAKLWCEGVKINTASLWKVRPNKVTLPEYPFLRERHWVTVKKNTENALETLHPLVDKNISTIHEACFAKTFKNEKVIREHIVFGNILVPGSAQVEMIRAAAQEAMGKTVHTIKNMCWLYPITVEGEKEVKISFQPDEEDVKVIVKDMKENVVFSSGRIDYQEPEEEQITMDHEIANVKENAIHIMYKNEIDDLFEEAGFGYGTGYQIMHTLWCGEWEAVAELKVSEDFKNDGYYLHPCIADAAFRVALGIDVQLRHNMKLRVPFSCDQITCYAPIESDCTVYVKIEEESRNVSRESMLCDVYILNKEGRCLAEFLGFNGRALKKSTSQNPVYYYKPFYQKAVLNEKRNSFGKCLVLGQQQGELPFVNKSNTDYVAFTDRTKDSYLQLLRQYQSDELTDIILVLADDVIESPYNKTAVEDDVETGFYQMWYLFQAICEVLPEKELIITVLLKNQANQMNIHEMIAGFAVSMLNINHHVHFRIMKNGTESDWTLLGTEFNNIYVQKENGNLTEYLITENEILEKGYQNISPSRTDKKLLKKEGIYLITGALGGVGTILLNYLAETYQASLILVGRSELNEEKQKKISELEKAGSKVRYYQADVSDIKSMEAVLEDSEKYFGAVNGVFHLAGSIHEISVLEAEKADYDGMLNPKVSGTLCLDWITRKKPLDFFSVFSSVSTAIGDYGIGAYAAGNAFLNHFAMVRNESVKSGERFGVTVAMNWPLWESKGMFLPDSVKAVYENYAGMTAMTQIEGCQAIEDALGMNESVIYCITGNKRKIDKVLKAESTIESIQENIVEKAVGVLEEQDSPKKSGNASYLKEVCQYLRNMLAETIDMPAEKIKMNTEFDILGIDSIMIMELNEKLEKEFPKLPKTLFFEYKTVETLAQYFIEKYPDLIEKKFGKKIEQMAANYAEPAMPHKSVEKNFTPVRMKSSTKSSKKQRSDIAIIGVSGIYPEAKDLDELWENLCNKKDCIQVIPEERWDYKKYYDPQKGKRGKIYAKWGGFIPDVDKFDASFFNMAPREAELMDPQERMFIETVWHAMEDAGYNKQQLKDKSVGVFASGMYSQYEAFGVEETLKGNPLATTSFLSSIANRVSYLCDFHGPSVGLDTACSSSLEAIRLACQNIWEGSCDMAVAGGVNLSIHPSKYLFLCQSTFLSSEGKCRSFGEGGDGYVPGEGVGALILKEYDQAVKEGDHIYGIIKGIATNHGGHTNGYSVPSPVAQSQVIKAALENANIEADTVSCIEAHGTGTALGDPIEIEGIKKGYAPDGVIPCSVGSIKSNVGHLEAAAGVAAVTKVLLEMKHKKLVPSIHSQELNHNIDLEDTRFYIQQEIQDWDSIEVMNEDGTVSHVRRAGISAFGAGGTNVHVVLEDYQEENFVKEDTLEDRLFILSARDKQALLNQAAILHSYLMKHEEECREHISDIAYTLIAGRNVFEERAAFCARTFEELQSKLAQLMVDEQGMQGIYIGSEFSNEAVFGSDDEEDKEYANSLIMNRKLDKIAKLWVNGTYFELIKLFEHENRKRVSLPGYPFRNKRCWIPVTEHTMQVTEKVIAPLLDENLSTLHHVEFMKNFAEHDQLLEQHIVNDMAILPGAAYVEMLYEAGRIACQNDFLTLRNIYFLKTYENKSKEKLHIKIVAGNDGCNKSRIYDDKDKTYFKGELIEGIEEASNHIPFIKEEIIQKCQLSFNGQQLNEYLIKAGFLYGEHYQKVKQVYATAKEAVVLIDWQENDDIFHMSPYQLDSVFRSVLAIGLCEVKEIMEPMVPYYIGSLKVYDRNQKMEIAHIRKTKQTDDGNMAGFQICIYSETGDLLIEIEDFMVRKLFDEKKQYEKLDHFYLPVWKKKENDAGTKINSGACVIVSNQREISEGLEEVLSDTLTTISVSSFQAIDARWILQNISDKKTDKLYIIDAIQLEKEEAASIDGSGAVEALEQRAYLFRKIANQLSDINVNHLVLLPLADGMLKPEDMILSGMINSVLSISPRYRMKLTAFGKADCKLSRMIPAIQREMEIRHSDGNIVKYEDGIRSVSVYEKADSAIEAGMEQQTVKVSGTYLITGGMGGLGRFTAEFLISKYQANVILVGRSMLSDEKRSFLNKLNAIGGHAEYVQADITNIKAMQQLIEHINETYGSLNGIFHCAGVTEKYLVTEVTQDKFRHMLDAKVKGTIILDEVTKAQNLDFFVNYSSISAFMGDYGAIAYAAASTFLDGFSAGRDKMVKRGLRKGHSLSINWPFWREGGVTLDSDSLRRYTEYSKLEVIEQQDGMLVLDKLLHTSYPNVVYLRGEKKNTDRLMKLEDSQSAGKEDINIKVETSGTNGEEMHKKLVDYLKNILAEVTKTEVENINSRSNFERYGVDSVMVIEINQMLEQDFSKLPNTLLFECHSIEELAAYLENKAGDKVKKLFEASNEQVKSQQTVVIAEEKESGEKNIEETWTLNSNRDWDLAEKDSVPNEQKTEEEEDIAIIGIQGRYPLADNLDEFWDNIKNGRNCITEIPQERWNWKDHYDKRRGTPGKSYSRYGGFIHDVDKFDPMFFHITPYEAEVMDPQERLFLETSWGAFEDAGYTEKKLEQIHHKVGVFVGVMNCNYEWLGAVAAAKGSNTNAHCAYWSIANRISYIMNLNGPSMAVDTACSSSLTAIHLACESIRNGGCKMAVAGGVNLILHPMHYIRYSMMNMIASDDKCKSFGTGADGFVDGEGVGAVILKRLKDAKKDGDRIYGVIKGSYLNACGKTNGYTVPSPTAQSEAIVNACERANINVQDITYIEAHGTGTSLGDPIEIAGLQKAFGDSGRRANTVSIGSVKGNIGHVEAAAGIASLTKVLLQMKYGMLVPSIHSDELNPNIDLEDTPFYIQHTYSEWKRREEMINGQKIVKPRIAGISSFGAGGANAHIIVQEYIGSDDKKEETDNTQEEQLILLSANTKDALVRQAVQLADYLEADNYDVEEYQENTDVVQHVREVLAEILDISVEDAEEECMISELGCDRILLNQAILELEKKYQRDFQSIDRNEDMTVMQLAESICKGIGRKIENVVRPAKGQHSESFEDIAFTLQTGRNHMKERFAFTASTRQKAVDILRNYIEGKNDGSYQTGTITSQMESIGSIGDSQMKELSNAKNYKEIIKYWLTGWDMEFGILHLEKNPNLVSLPTYPFEKTRYWIPELEGKLETQNRTSALNNTVIEKVLDLLSTKQISIEDADKIIEVMLNE